MIRPLATQTIWLRHRAASTTPPSCALVMALAISGCGSVGGKPRDAPEDSPDACSTPACTDLVAYWKLDGNTEDVIAGRSLTRLGGVDWGPGYTGAETDRALEFDGKDGRAIVDNPVPGRDSSDNLSNLSSLTFTARIKPRSGGNCEPLGTLCVILAKAGAGGDAVKRWLINNPSGMTAPPVSPGGLEISVNRGDKADDSDTAQAFSRTVVSFSTWQFVAATFDPADRARLYIQQGNLLEEVPYRSNAAGAGAPKDDAQTPYYIGSWPDGISGSFFDGAIDEIQIYKRALTLSELQMVFQTTP